MDLTRTTAKDEGIWRAANAAQCRSDSQLTHRLQAQTEDVGFIGFFFNLPYELIIPHNRVRIPQPQRGCVTPPRIVTVARRNPVGAENRTFAPVKGKGFG